MAVGKGSIKRAAKAVDSTVAAPAKEVVEAIVEKAPAKKTAVKKAPAKKKAPVKKEEVKETNIIGIGTELPSYLL